MRNGDPRDPLLRQILPMEQELEDVPGYDIDPVRDEAAIVRPGLLKKYAGRSLIVPTMSCAVHCRYCFRRHLTTRRLARDRDTAINRWQPILTELARDRSTHEVLLSGGDPLMLPDDELAGLVARLSEIAHLRRLRIHSRLPVVIPQRITDRLLHVLASARMTTVFVIHANHPHELDRFVARAVARIVDAGLPLLNQSVLLRGVNDGAETLIQLCQRLVDLRIMPYYLHQLDQVVGAAHFHVPVERGRQLIAQLRAALPGYAVPRYVQEVPGHPHKKVLA
jgi:EF-P beta-lysylation protein EpmB